MERNCFESQLIVNSDDYLRNRFGSIKLKLVRGFYGLNIDSRIASEITGHYVEWRDTVELLPMRVWFKKSGFKDFSGLPVDVDKWIGCYCSSTGFLAARFNDNPLCNVVSYDYKYSKWVNKKSVKRGNDVYIRLLKDKFNPFFNSKNHKCFFSTVVNSRRKRVQHTRMLYVTGTCDHNITGDISASWVAFGKYWNEFITRIRDTFGKVAYIRTWQSQDNGYPHFHSLIYFFDFEFSVVYWHQDNSFRVHNRQKVVVNHRSGKKDFCRDVIKSFWKWGHLDVKCCDNTKDALKDLLKYVTRDLKGGSADLTNAMVWYFGKKSFAVSDAFYDLFGGCASLEPSDADLINAEGVIQEVIQEDKLIGIDVFPVIPRDLMPYYTQLTLVDWMDPPDPPPEMCEFLDNFADSCEPVKFNHLDNGVVVTIYKYKGGDNFYG